MKNKELARKVAAVALSCAMVMGLAACSSGGNADGESETEKATAKGGADGTVTIMHNQEIPGLDMFDAQIGGAGTSIQMLWGDQLVNADHYGEYIPWLAKEWTMSEDSLSCTFTLRDDVVFSDGSAMTADDVVFTFERLRDDTELTNSGKWAPFIKTVEATDDYTVVLTFNSPMANFYSQLCQVPILCKAAYEADPEGYWDAPVGSGPYVITNNDAVNGTVELEKREDYWGWAEATESNVEKIIFKYSTEDTSRISALRAGEIEVCEAVPQTDVETLEEEGFKVVQQNALSHMFIQFNCGEGEIFNDKVIREAVSLCIDREQLVSAILGGGVPADWACNNDAPGYVGDGYEYNPEKAKEVLESSSYNGEEVVLLSTTGIARSTEVTQALQTMMSQIGLNVKIDTNEQATYMDRRFASDFDMTFTTFTGNCNDWYVECAEIVGANLFGTQYENAELSEICAELNTTADPEKLKEIYEKIYQIEMDEYAPNIYLYQPLEINACAANISGITFYPETTADYRFMTIE